MTRKAGERVKRFWKGRGPEESPVLLGPRRVYILPTGEGFAFAFAVLVILLGSLNYQSSLGFMLAFLLASVGLVSMIHTQRNLAGVTVTVEPAPPVFAGESAHFPLRLDSPSGKKRYSLVVEQKGGERQAADISAGPAILVLAKGELRRGVASLGLVNLTTRYPLGFFRAWAPFESSATCVVYPAPLFTPLAAAQTGGGEESPGQALSPQKGGVEDFYGLREWERGDTPARVHWKSFARSGALLVKEFEEARAASLLFDYGRLDGYDPETRLSLLCGWVVTAERADKSYSLSLPGTTIGQGRGAEQRARCLAALARFEE